MRKVQTELAFKGGFVSPPIPRDRTGDGCPDMQNLVLTPDGTAIRPMPGFRRTMPVNLLYQPYVGRHNAAAQAAGSFIFSGVPADGATVEMGARVFTFTENAGNLATTIRNLADAINAQSSLGLLAVADSESDEIALTALTAGTAGNGVAFTCIDAGVSVPATLSGGVDMARASATVVFSAQPAVQDYFTITNGSTKIGFLFVDSMSDEMDVPGAAHTFMVERGPTAGRTVKNLAAKMASTLPVMTGYREEIGFDVSYTAPESGDCWITVESLLDGTDASDIVLAKSGANITVNAMAGGVDAVAASGTITFSAAPDVGAVVEAAIAARSIEVDFVFYIGTYTGDEVGVLMFSPPHRAVWLGATAAATAANLLAAIVADGERMTQAWIVTDTTVVVQALNTGAEGNGITLSSSDANVTAYGLAGGVSDSYSYAWYATAGEIPAGDTAISGKLLIVSFAPQAFLTNGGRGLAVVDQVTGRILAVGFHPGGVPLDPVNVAADRLPVILGALNRQGAHDYVGIVPFAGMTWFLTPWDGVMVFDGARLRPAGLRAPEVEPQVRVGAENSDLTPILTEAAEATWLSGPVSLSSSQPSGASTPSLTLSGFRYSYFDGLQRLAVFTQGTESPVAVLAEPVTLSAATGAVRVNLRWTGTKTLPGGSLALLVGDDVPIEYDSPYPTGRPQKALGIAQNANTQRITVEQNLESGRDYVIDLPWTAGAFVIETLSWYCAKALYDVQALEAGLDPTGSIDFSLESVESSGSSLLQTGRHLLGFSWYDSARGRESNISPYGEVSLVAGAPVLLDLSGAWENAPTGIGNQNPDPENCDSVRVYIHREAWGTDGQGYPMMRLYQEMAIPLPDSAGGRWVTLAGERDEADVLADKGAEYERHVPPPVSCGVVDGERLLLGNRPSYSVGRVYVGDDAKVATRLRKWTSGSVTAWSASDPSSKAFTLVSGEKYANDADSTDFAFTSSDPSSLAFTEDLTVRSAWGPWMEQREIRLGSSSERFTVIKVLPNAAGEYDRVYFYREDVTGIRHGYTGSTWASTTWELPGYPNRIYWTSKEAIGAYPEGVGLANYLDLEMPGDEILTLGHVGDFVVALGRQRLVYLLQNDAAVDGVPATGHPFPRPRSDQGGTVSGRTFVQMPNRQALYLSPEGKLMLLTTDGAQEHPISKLFGGWITSQYRLSTNMLRHAHAVYDGRTNRYILFLADSGDPDGSDKFGQWPDAAPTDRFVDWTEV